MFLSLSGQKWETTEKLLSGVETPYMELTKGRQENCYGLSLTYHSVEFNLPDYFCSLDIMKMGSFCIFKFYNWHMFSAILIGY